MVEAGGSREQREPGFKLKERLRRKWICQVEPS